MNKYLIGLVIVVSIFITSAAFTADCCKAKEQPKIKVLFTAGGYEGHPVSLTPILKDFLEKTGQFTVFVTEDRNYYKTGNIKKFDTVLCFTTVGDNVEGQVNGLTDFVKNGGGFVGIHSATDSYRTSDEYWKLVGGRFIGHEYNTFNVYITGKSHPIVKGMSDFTVTDETYHHKFNPESKIVVLNRRSLDGEPVSWVQYYGQGRMFTTGIGHTKSTWEDTNFQEMIKRALLWSVKRLNP